MQTEGNVQGRRGEGYLGEEKVRSEQANMGGFYCSFSFFSHFE